MTEIKISLTDAALQILPQVGVDPFKYGPAYDGESVGLDLYNTGPDIQIPGRNKWTAFEEPTLLIPTGVRVCLPKNTVALIKERGSITKSGLIARAGVIDPGYTGEIFVNLVNIGERLTSLPTGCKLPVQLIVLQCHQQFSTVDYSEYLRLTNKSLRNDGSVGSSDLEQGASTQDGGDESQ